MLERRRSRDEAVMFTVPVTPSLPLPLPSPPTSKLRDRRGGAGWMALVSRGKGGRPGKE